MKKAAFFVLFLLCFAVAPAEAVVMGIAFGDLVKLADDGDPATSADRAIYYIDQDWTRRPFLNQRVYDSWYKDFSTVKTLTPTEMAEFRIGKPVVYRPGTRLVKIPSVPKVYAVEPGGVLRWIISEEVAIALYGSDWAKRVDDVPEAFFFNYKEGVPLTAPVFPTGTIVRRASEPTLYFIEALGKRFVSPSVLPTLHLNDAHVVVTADDLSPYADLASVPADQRKYWDTSQKEMVDTLPAPAFDFPTRSVKVTPGFPVAENVLASFRLATGTPAIIRRLRVRIDGPLWSGTTPRLTGIAFVDDKGVNMFGTQELSMAGASGETLIFSGAHTTRENSFTTIELRATVVSDLPPGAAFTVTIEREGVKLGDGTNGNDLPAFSPSTPFPPLTASK